MDNKKVFRLICVVLVQIAILDIILGFLVIKKAGSTKTAAKENSLTQSSSTVSKQDTKSEDKNSHLQSRKFGEKAYQDKIVSMVYKKPVTIYYSGLLSSVNMSLIKKGILSMIYSQPVIPYTIPAESSKEKLQNIDQKYLSLIYHKPLFDISDSGDIKLEPDEPLFQDYIATAYDLSYESCGKYPGHHEYGITFSGKKAVKGRTVAVDPKFIPLGSLVYIRFPEPYQQMNGWYTAEDTGSKVKGKIVDVFLGESALTEARNFGKRNVEIQVIDSH